MSAVTKIRFDSIQYLRAIAALMVVLHHARNPMPGLFNPLEHYMGFAWGVDIFFVISGFIMYAVAIDERPNDFLIRRLIRIVPLYWGSTVALLLINEKLGIFSISPELLTHIAKSLAFIPHYSFSHDGHIYPYLVPGWTLSYEMLFYLIFFIGLLLNRVMLTLFATIVPLVFCGLLQTDDGSVLQTFTRPILLEFLLGVVIASAYLKGYLRTSAGWLLPIGFVGLMSLPMVKECFPLIWGKIAFSSIIVTGAVALSSVTPISSTWHLLGDASYSIYLTHIFLSLRIARKIFVAIPVDGWLQFLLWVSLSLCISAIVGVIIYILIERPMLRWLRSRLIPKTVLTE